VSFTPIWRYTPQEGAARVVIGHPGGYSPSSEEAMDEGRRVLADLEPPFKTCLMPLAIVETNETMEDDIQEKCEEVEIGSELLFYDVTERDEWKKEAWWPR